jgi:hypothetical protein
MKNFEDLSDEEALAGTSIEHVTGEATPGNDTDLDKLISINRPQAKEADEHNENGDENGDDGVANDNETYRQAA